MLTCSYKTHTMTNIRSFRAIFPHSHLHLPVSSPSFLSYFYVTWHVCTQYQYCVWVVWCLHAFVIYISPHHLPSLLQHTPPAPVLSVPTGSKGVVSSTSLQRSRSDVDVNAAAVAKQRHSGQTKAAGRLPPGSYSSLGKGLSVELDD